MPTASTQLGAKALRLYEWNSHAYRLDADSANNGENRTVLIERESTARVEDGMALEVTVRLRENQRATTKTREEIVYFLYR